MTKTEKATARLTKAEQRLTWSEQLLTEMRTHGAFGRMDDVERVFCTMLFHLSSVRESIESACKFAGLVTWREAFITTCLNDALLVYMWRARDAEAHDSLIKWSNGGRVLQIEILDAQKANSIPTRFPHYNNQTSLLADLYEFIYQANGHSDLMRKVQENSQPSEIAMKNAGVKLTYAAETLLLKSFSFRAKEQGKKFTIDEPRTHLGKPIPAQADAASEETIKFFREKLKELRQLLNALPPQAPEAAPP